MSSECYLCDIETYSPTKEIRQIAYVRLYKSDILARKYKKRRKVPARIAKQIRRLKPSEPVRVVEYLSIAKEALAPLTVKVEPEIKFDKTLWKRYMTQNPITWAGAQ